MRFDSQTELNDEERYISHSAVKSWLEHDAVLQGGELTGWPRLVRWRRYDVALDSGSKTNEKEN